MNGKLWLGAVLFLVGLLISGTAGIIRSDWLGKEAAEAVEERVNERLERAEERTHDAFEHIMLQLKEIRDKLD